MIEFEKFKPGRIEQEMRDHRLIKDLSEHEIDELDEDYGIDVSRSDAYILAILNQKEWERIKYERQVEKK